MVRESEVRAALALLPDESWLKQYCLYAERQVDSHILYHVATGTSLLSVTAPRSLLGEGPGFKRPTVATWFAWIIGGSGEAEKSIAMDVGLDLLALVAPTLIAPAPTADTSLAKLLSAHGNQLFTYSEGGKFLAATQGYNNPVGAGLRKAYTDMFDGRTTAIAYSKGDPIIVENPRPNLLAACTPVDLETCTTTVDWQGGFMSRFFIAYGERERFIDNPVAMPEHAAWLAGWLERASREPTTAKCIGFDEGARALWDAWRNDVRERYAQELRDENRAGLLSRSRLICAKLCVLLAWASGRAWVAQGHWWVSVAEMRVAIALTDLHIASAMDLVSRIQPSREMQEQYRLFAVIGTSWTAEGDAVRAAKLTARRAKPYLETLLLQGMIAHEQQGTTNYYRQVPEGACVPYDDAFVLPPAPMRPDA